MAERKKRGDAYDTEWLDRILDEQHALQHLVETASLWGSLRLTKREEDSIKDDIAREIRRVVARFRRRS